MSCQLRVLMTNLGPKLDDSKMSQNDSRLRRDAAVKNNEEFEMQCWRSRTDLTLIKEISTQTPLFRVFPLNLVCISIIFRPISGFYI
jgi:hypothetical protein